MLARVHVYEELSKMVNKKHSCNNRLRNEKRLFWLLREELSLLGNKPFLERVWGEGVTVCYSEPHLRR